MISLRQEAGFLAIENWLKLHSFLPARFTDAADDVPDFSSGGQLSIASVKRAGDDTVPKAEDDRSIAHVLLGPITGLDIFAPIGTEGDVDSAFDLAPFLAAHPAAIAVGNGLASTAFERETETLYGSHFSRGYQSDGEFVPSLGELMPVEAPMF